MTEEHELADYEQAMDEVLAELEVPKGLATTADLELADKAPLVAAVRERQATWGDALADAVRGIESRANCAYCSHPHTDHMHDNPRRLCRQCMCTGYVTELPAGSG